MSDELTELLDHVERSCKVQSEELSQTEEKFTLLLRQLDGLKEER